MKTTSWTRGLAVAAVALLAACASPSVNTVERQTTVGTRTMVADRRVITDKNLAQIVSVVGVNQATVSGLLKIQVEVVNRTSDTQNFSYLIEWFDATGMIVPTPTATWINRQILAQQTLAITALAPIESAKDFRIQLAHK